MRVAFCRRGVRWDESTKRAVSCIVQASEDQDGHCARTRVKCKRGQGRHIDGGDDVMRCVAGNRDQVTFFGFRSAHTDRDGKTR
jgi:hypothetical protein